MRNHHALALALVLGAASPASAFRAHTATFQGPVADDRASGVAGDNVGTPKVEPGTCADAGVSAAGSCSVTWTLDAGKAVCDLAPRAAAGIATYTSSQGDSVDFALVGGAERGVMEGVFPFGDPDDPYATVGHLHLDASEACAGGARRFSGWLDLP